jgi:transposase
MNPIIKDQFTLSLGAEKPWVCTKVKFSSEACLQNNWNNIARISEFPYPKCAAKKSGVHDTVDKGLRHMNYFQHMSYLHARVPRVRCGESGVHFVHVPWARLGSGFTLLFEVLVLCLQGQRKEEFVAVGACQHRTQTRVICCQLETMVEHARKMRRHWVCILRSMVADLAYAVVEGINSILQLVRTRARGFRSMKNYIAKIYLDCGKLHFDLPT